MESVINTVVNYLLPFVFVLGLLIIVHEFGHFILAKLSGIRVERFSIGFPPRLFGVKWGDTDYCISALPFGGYVKMSGMIDESMEKDSIKGEPYEFMSKPIWVRSLVISAGPVFNVLLTVFIFTASFLASGVPEAVGPVVGSVGEETPAQALGLLAGDTITRIDGQELDQWEDLVHIIHNAPGRELAIEWQRDGESFSGTVVPEKDLIQDIGLIGIGPKTEVRPAGFFESVGLGFSSTYNLSKLIFRSFGLLFRGEVKFKEGLAGPVRIAQMAGDSAKGGFGNLLVFAAFLSLNLGFLNLLPFPVLDGGHLVFLGIEAVIRRPLSVKLKLIVQQVGMALLLALMLYVIFNDVTHII